MFFLFWIIFLFFLRYYFLFIIIFFNICQNLFSFWNIHFNFCQNKWYFCHNKFSFFHILRVVKLYGYLNIDLYWKKVYRQNAKRAIFKIQNARNAFRVKNARKINARVISVIITNSTISSYLNKFNFVNDERCWFQIWEYLTNEICFFILSNIVNDQ